MVVSSVISSADQGSGCNGARGPRVQPMLIAHVGIAAGGRSCLRLDVKTASVRWRRRFA